MPMRAYHMRLMQHYAERFSPTYACSDDGFMVKKTQKRRVFVRTAWILLRSSSSTSRIVGKNFNVFRCIVEYLGLMPMGMRVGRLHISKRTFAFLRIS